MQLSPISTTPPAPLGWVERPDLAGSRLEWETPIGRAVSANEAGRLADGVLDHFDRNGNGALDASEAESVQQWTFASDAHGSDRPQFIYSHSTIRQEFVTIASLRDAAAGTDDVADRAELTALLGSLDLANGLLHHELGPTLVKARQVTVPGKLFGTSSGHLIEDPWNPLRI